MLVDDRTSKSQLSEVRVCESQFADDAEVYAKHRDVFEAVMSVIVESASSYD